MNKTLPVEERRVLLRAAIEDINATLRGPRVSDIERLMLNADRHDFRRELEELERTPLRESVVGS